MALLGSDGFDVEEVERESLRFGPAAARPLGRRGGLRFDVDRDGHADLVSSYPLRDTGIALGDTEACVEGQRRTGLDFRGCDVIKTVPRCGSGAETALLVPPAVWLVQRRRLVASSKTA